ncbi:MAG TPA: flagellar biosynthetic protein FliO [Bryobacteraceae bacterium]|jgi:flagellar biogenesis protein FliO|nr:flagellar biosynthetic protein FliO [Bryobacteraceae bacterium]
MDAVQPLIAIVLVMALLGGALAVLRKRGVVSFDSRAASTRGRRMVVVERVALGPQHALHLVKAGGRLLLVATAPGSCQLLDREVDGNFDSEVRV